MWVFVAFFWSGLLSRMEEVMINLYLTGFFYYYYFQDNSLIKLRILSTPIEGIPNERDFVILKKYDRLAGGRVTINILEHWEIKEFRIYPEVHKWYILNKSFWA